MPRPLKQGLDYFPHDTDASGDEKLQSLMALHGPAGYCFYFIMLEKVFRTENARITCGKPVEKAGLARLMCITLKQFDAIMETAIEVGCFDPTEWEQSKVITSNGIQKRIAMVLSIRSKERERKERIKESLKKKDKKKYKKEIEIETIRGKTTGKRTENSETGVESHSDLLNVKDFIAKYCESFKAIYGKNPVVTQKDAGIASRLIKIPDIQGIMEKFFQSSDKFITDACHSLSIVESQVNKLSVNKKKSGIDSWVARKEAELAEG